MVALHRAKSINGWMSDAELQFLAETASNANIIYEVGSYMGRSTRAMGDNTPGVVHAIDPWGIENFDANGNSVLYETDGNIFNIFYCNLADLISKGKVIPHRSKWQGFKPRQYADFIFIDGDHRFKSIRDDILQAYMWIKSGGIIAGHDYAPPWYDVIQAVNGFFHNKTISTVGSIWWVKI